MSRASLLIAAALAMLATSTAWGQGAPPADPDAPTVMLRPEKGKVQLGETFKVWITVLHAPYMTISLDTTGGFGGFEEAADRVETATVEKDGLTKSVYELTLGGFQVGKQQLAAVGVNYTVGNELRKLRTDAIEIEVLTVIGDGKEELRPLAPPVSIYRKDYTPLWIGGGALAALGLLAFGWFLARRTAARRRMARDPAIALRNLPPEEQALEKLRALAASGALDAEDVRPVFFGATDIIREYLGRRYGFDALELTTSELLETLERRIDRRVPEARAEIGAWLDHCDLVKYARQPVERADAERALEGAVSLVERTRPRAEAPAPPPTDAPGSATGSATGGATGGATVTSPAVPPPAASSPAQEQQG